MDKRTLSSIFYMTSSMRRKDSIATDFTGPSLFVDSPIWSDYAELPIRFITEINRENMMYCEKFLKVCD